MYGQYIIAGFKVSGFSQIKNTVEHFAGVHRLYHDACILHKLLNELDKLGRGFSVAAKVIIEV